MGVRNVDVIGSTKTSVGRAAIAVLLAVIGTVGLFWSMLKLQLVSGTWTLAGGYVVVHFPFRVYNVIWLAARAILGLYISFVVVVIGLQLLGYWRRMTTESGHVTEAAEPDEGSTERGRLRGLARFNQIQVYTHGLLALSILVLWVTGLPITFNQALGWVYAILGGQTAIGIHVVAGGVLTGTLIFFTVYGFMGLVNGESTIRNIGPQVDDLYEGIDHVKYLLGRGPEPEADKYTVLQKAETWIIAFESVVMMWTGLMLWSATRTTRSPPGFDTLLTEWPAPFMMILRDIHAIVGITMLAGITFHLFMTHIKEWPLDESMFTGVVGIGRACEEWSTWATEKTGLSDVPCSEYSWRPALNLGALAGMGIFAIAWLGAVLQYTLAPLPTGGLSVLEDISPAGLPGGTLGEVFSVGLNFAFLVVLLAIVALVWGFTIRFRRAKE